MLVALATGAACAAAVFPGTPSAATPGPPIPAPSTQSPSQPTDRPTSQPSPTDSPGTEQLPEVPPDPLQVVIERLTPSALPAPGKVRVRGTITNTSEEDWSDLGVYLFTSFEPMTTPDAMAAAIASDPRTDVGDRIVEPGLFTEAPDLAPGEETPFELSVPVEELVISGAAGVYWVGVHVLGTNAVGRLEGADGRARTFLPLVPERSTGTQLALGIQLRRQVVRAPDGRVRFLEGWQSTLAEDGRLRTVLDLGRSAPADLPLGWVVDPAVIDAALSVSQGNPALELGGADDPGDTEGQDGDTQGDSDEDTDGGTDGGTDEDSGSEGDEDEQTDPDGTTPEGAAATWIVDLVDEAADHTLFALPYADLDVSAVARHGVSDLLTSAFASSTNVLDERELTSTPLLLPPSGLMAPGAFADIEPGLPVVLEPSAVDGAPAGPLLNRIDGGRILLAPGPEELWGPEPGAPRSALAVRQRLLADAALHALSGDRDRTLVRFLPPQWDPGEDWQRARFFEGLDVPWLTPVDVGDVLTGVSGEPAVDPAQDLVYPDAALQAELPLPTVLATESLIAEGSTVEELVTVESAIDELVVRQALLTSSVWSRPRPGRAADRAVATRDRVTGGLEAITVRGPSFVTMSSETGTFQVTVINGLDQRVTVGLRASVPGGDLELSTPEPLELPPNGRGAMRIDARASDIGVHLVTLQPVSTEGTPLGESTQLSIRSSRVGLILWFVMGIGGTALLVAIVLRIWRRVRQRRRTHGPVLRRVHP